MKARVSLPLTALALLLVLSMAVGCSKAPNDAQITSDVQSRMNADSGLQGKQLSVQTENGTVTLSGAVDNDAERQAAARYASTVPGVKQVINNLQAAPAPAMAQMAEAPAPAPAPVPESKPTPAPKPRPKHRDRVDRDRSAQDRSPAPVPDQNATTSAALTPAPAPAPAPAPPPPPVKVTIPSGTTLAVRLVDTIDSEKSQQGQTFHATLDSPLAVEGDVVLPNGSDVEGHLVTVQSAGKFAGQSLVVLQLDRISAGGKYYNVQTDQYKKQGSSRGKNTAEKVGAGAGIGAIIGALAGGGKGAAIGAAAGGGLGGGVQAATKGQQIKLASETVLNFTLQAPVTVVLSKNPNDNRPRLDSPNNQ